MDESHKSRYVPTLSKTLCIYLRKKGIAFETWCVYSVVYYVFKDDGESSFTYWCCVKM